MKFFYDEGGISSYINLHEDYCGFEGITHGGIIVTLLDEIGAWTIFASLKKIAVTQESQIKFLKPVFTNQLLKVEGRIITHNNNLITTLSIIKNEKGIILSESENKWLIVSAETLSKISNIDLEQVTEMINKALETL